MNIIIDALISLAVIPVFWLVFRFKLRYIPLGFLAITVSFFVESFEMNIIGNGFIVLMIVFLAPVIEESAKFLLTWFGKTKAGIPLGLGFAVAENFLYYIGYPTMLFHVILMREFQDPLLHMTSTRVSSDAWKKVSRYPLAIGIHMFYNIIALTNDFWMITAVSLCYLGILILIKKKEKKNLGGEIKSISLPVR